MRLVFWLAVIALGTWLGFRLWPAIRSEPSTWFGPDWRQRLPV